MQAKTLKEAAELLPKFLLVKNGKYIPTDNNRHEDYFELSIITNEIVFYQGKGKSIYQMDLVTPIIEFDFLNAFLELHQKLITNSIL